MSLRDKLFPKKAVLADEVADRLTRLVVKSIVRFLDERRATLATLDAADVLLSLSALHEIDTVAVFSSVSNAGAQLVRRAVDTDSSLMPILLDRLARADETKNEMAKRLLARTLENLEKYLESNGGADSREDTAAVLLPEVRKLARGLDGAFANRRIVSPLHIVAESGLGDVIWLRLRVEVANRALVLAEESDTHKQHHLGPHYWEGKKTLEMMGLPPEELAVMQLVLELHRAVNLATCTDFLRRVTSRLQVME